MIYQCLYDSEMPLKSGKVQGSELIFITFLIYPGPQDLSRLFLVVPRISNQGVDSVWVKVQYRKVEKCVSFLIFLGY